MPGFHSSLCLIKKLQNLTAGTGLLGVQVFLSFIPAQVDQPYPLRDLRHTRCPRRKFQACSQKCLLKFIIWGQRSNLALEVNEGEWILPGDVGRVGEREGTMKRKQIESKLWKRDSESLWRMVWKKVTVYFLRILTMEPAVMCNIDAWCAAKTINKRPDSGAGVSP